MRRRKRETPMANQRPGIASGASGEIGDISVVGQLIGAGPAHGFGWPRLGNRHAALWGNSAIGRGDVALSSSLLPGAAGGLKAVAELLRFAVGLCRQAHAIERARASAPQTEPRTNGVMPPITL